MRGDVRAAVAFAMAALALIPVSLVSLLLGMASGSPAVAMVAMPLFFAAQWAFPQALESNTTYHSFHVPMPAVIILWLALAIAFGLVASRLRIRRLWLAAPCAVVACILVGNVILYFTGYHALLDGP